MSFNGLSKEYSKNVDENLKAYSKANLSADEKKSLNTLFSLWEEYKILCENMFQESSKQTPAGEAAALSFVKNEGRSKARVIDGILENLLQAQIKQSEELKKAADNDYNSARNTTIIVIIMGFLISMGMGFVFSRSISKPLGELEGVANEIAEGNLTKNISLTEGSDEISSLSRSVHMMLNNLRGFVKHVQETAQMVAGASQQLTSNAQQTSAAASEAASTVSEIATTMEQVAQNSQEVAALSEEASKEAAQGSKDIGRVTKEMEDIATTSDEASKVIDSLSNTLIQVNQIVDLITHIAAQTNLLALNAAIEAARAGEQGRGFAVVAEEVRKLAEQSANATQDISQLIGKVQVESKRAVEAMVEGNKQIKEGVTVVEEVGNRFKGIISLIENLADQIQDVAASSEQVSAGVQNVASATEEQTAAMEEVSDATEQLTNMANELNQLVAKYML